jgi:hypothetical protein
MSAPLDALTGIESTRIKLPRVADPSASRENANAGRNPIFDLLVQNEGDTVGLLAYALYKQNKRDWLIAHNARDGRAPTQAELDAFILGESIPRRLATYRRLAEDQLAGDAAVGRKPGLLDGLMAAPANDAQQPGAAKPAGSPITWKYVAFLLAMLVAMAVLFRLAAGWLFGTGR